MNDPSIPSSDPESPDKETTLPAPGSSKPRTPSPIIVAFCMVIVALLVVLIIQGVSGNNGEYSSEDSPTIDSMQANLETQRAILNRERIAMGMAPMAGANGAEAAEEVAARLKTDADTLASLAGSFQILLEDKDRELDLARKEAIDSLKDTRRIRELYEAVCIERDKALIDATRISTLQAQLDAANSRIALLDAELLRLRDEPARLKQELLICQSERSQLINRIAQLEAELNRVDLFAATENQILKEAIALVRALRKLQGSTPSELSSAYSRFGATLGAEVLKTCEFPTGSSDVPDELMGNILSLPQEIADGAMILVVGYASETGNVDSNERLSSDRATAVAQLLDNSKRVGQKVQAVYLGQTKRFSGKTPEINQRVEIWQILPPAE